MRWWVVTLMLGAIACGGRSGSREPERAHYGSITVFAAASAPFYAIVVAPIKAEEREGTVDTLLPELARQAGELGADALVIEEIESRFEIHERSVLERGLECPVDRGQEDNSVNCTHVVKHTTEVLVVSMRGHALRVK